VSQTGLTSAEAKLLLARDGANVIQTKAKDSVLRQLLKQFANPIVLILALAAVISMVVGDATDGIIVLCILVPSTLLGFFQERRAGAIMNSLLSQVAATSTVYRDGKLVTLPQSQLVVGDVVSLKTGDTVPADLEILESHSMLVDESALTGESFPAEKSSGQLMLGTHLVSGSGIAKVAKVGANTVFGKLGKKLVSADPETGFELGIKRFGLLIARYMLGLVAVIFVVNLVLQRPWLESLLFALALAVGLTPQLLPAIVSVSLATGAKQMARQKVLVKRLDAIEDFGSMTALCTDKTGTLTIGSVELKDAIDLAGEHSDDVLRLGYLNAKLQTGFANPIDDCLIKAAGQQAKEPKLVAELPYDFQRRRLSIATSDGLMITKGAFESVVAVCSAGVTDAVHQLYQRLSAEGNRVLAVATKKYSGQLVEDGMALVGLLIFADPLKPDAAATVKSLQDLGIELYLITGDNPLVAGAVATSAGLGSGEVLTGVDLDKLDDKALDAKLATCRVFAQVDPLQKERVVLRLRALGHVVGYSGDGINDSAAIKAADVGISVDTAVEVAKSAAAIVLLDPSLEVVAHGVKLGRKIFVNTMKYIKVGLSAAFGNVLSMAAASMFLSFLPLLPAQILLLNFMSDFPDLTIAGDNVDAEQIAKPQTWDIRELRNYMIRFGVLSSVFDMLTFATLIIGFGGGEKLVHSGWFVESTLTELTVMLVLRTRRPFWKSRPSKGLLLSTLALAVLVVLIPFTVVGAALQLEPLTGPVLLSLFGLIAIYTFLNEVLKRFSRRS
jgi:Mg2+-importing ATPase